MATPRTPDDGRNERQRPPDTDEDRERFKREHDDSRNKQQQQREQDIEEARRQAEERENEIREAHERQRNDPHSGEIDQTVRPDPAAEDSERERLLVEKPFDFIERTRPEDPSDKPGQQTRDNVNPAIPSATPGTGDVVRPMSTAGGTPPAPLESQPEQWPKKDPVTGAAAPREVPPLPDATPDQMAARYVSANEPWGSNVGGEAGDTGGTTPAALDLTGLNPDHGTIGTPVLCSVHGTGFTADCVVIIDDEEVPATFVNSGKFTVDVPMAEEPGSVDVEVGRGEEFSDVLTFEWLAAAGGTRKSEKSQRKPKKVEPVAKRTKTKQKGKR